MPADCGVGFRAMTTIRWGRPLLVGVVSRPASMKTADAGEHEREPTRAGVSEVAVAPSTAAEEDFDGFVAARGSALWRSAWYWAPTQRISAMLDAVLHSIAPPTGRVRGKLSASGGVMVVPRRSDGTAA